MTDLVKRLLTVQFEGGTNYAKYSYPDIEIHVDVPFDDDPTANEATITLFNLSTSSINKIKKDMKMTVAGGTAKESGTLMEGVISKTNTTYVGADKQTVITLTDFGNFAKKTADITFANNTKASTILKRLCSVAGTSPATMQLPKDKVYTSGYKVSGAIEDAFVEVIRDCGAAFYWRRGRMYIRDLKKGDDERFNLSSDTGLTGSPAYVETEDYKGYNIRCVLQHRISTASIITLNSKTVKGTFRVKSGRHTFDGSSYITEALVIM